MCSLLSFLRIFLEYSDDFEMTLKRYNTNANIQKLGRK